MRVDTTGKVETSAGRRAMKICVEQAKRWNKGSPSLPVLPAMTDLTLQNSNADLYTKAQASMWALSAR